MTQTGRRYVAVVPAAGRSERMGRPKLLLPVGDRTVIEHVVAAWKSGGIADVVVVVSPDNEPLARLVQSTGAHLVVPDVPPPDMKSSVQHALQFVSRKWQFSSQDAWLLAPADMPDLPGKIIGELVQIHSTSAPEILVPQCGGRRGHPVLFPWSLAAEVLKLPADVGINTLVRRTPTRLVETDEPRILADLDTPEDYRQLTSREEEPQRAPRTQSRHTPR